MAQLSAKTSIDKHLLIELAESRLNESRALQKQFAAASIYLGGYAVECYLKAAICKTLDLDELPNTFKSHDLEVLLMHSGLRRRLFRVQAVQDSFGKIVGEWNLEGADDSIRYRSPSAYLPPDAEAFHGLLIDETRGVIPWLKKQT